MALERRNALVARLLGVMREDQSTHLAIGRGFHAMDFDSEGRNRSLGIGGGMGKNLLSSEAGMVMLVGLIGLGLFSYVMTKLFGESEEEEVYHNGKKPMGERVKDMVGLGDKTPDPSVGVAITQGVSPLVPKDAEVTRIKTAKSTQEQRDAIAAGAKDAGIDYQLLYAVAGSESSFRNTVSAETSSAVGLLQFTGPTWNYLCKMLKLDYTPEDRNDPVKASKVAGLYLKQIATTLTKVLGRPPSYGETYLGYFLGPTGGSNFLRALIQNPNAIGAELFPKAANANKGIFYSKGSPLTLGQILAKLEGKIGSYAGDAGTDLAKAKGGTSQGVTTATAPSVPQSNSTSASAQPSKLNAPTASASPQTQQVSLPTNEINNVKIKARQAETTPAEKADRVADASPAPQAAPSGPKASDDSLPFKGRDGRLYKG